MTSSLQTRQTLQMVAVAAGLLAAVALASPAADDTKSADGWVPLFNGKDLTGWKIHPEPNKGAIKKVIEKEDGGKVVGYDAETKDGKTVSLWSVKDGMLVGAGPASHLFSEKDDYTDFHYRVEVKINDKGNSGQYFRTKFESGFPTGYEAQINATHGDWRRSGSLYPDARAGLREFEKDICVKDAPNKPDEFFTQEVIAKGNHIQILVNGKKLVDFTHPKQTLTKGHFALQGHDPGTVVTFKKIEYKPLAK
jgi:hypothetical protein